MGGPEPTFDPYYTWLGIPPQHQPPDHYRLLGVQRFEGNRDVLSHALDQRMAFVRTFQNGPRADWSQQILNEIAAAGAVLFDAHRKAEYDGRLQAPAPAKRRSPPEDKQAGDTGAVEPEGVAAPPKRRRVAPAKMRSAAGQQTPLGAPPRRAVAEHVAPLTAAVRPTPAVAVQPTASRARARNPRWPAHRLTVGIAMAALVLGLGYAVFKRAGTDGAPPEREKLADRQPPVNDPLGGAAALFAELDTSTAAAETTTGDNASHAPIAPTEGATDPRRGQLLAPPSWGRPVNPASVASPSGDQQANVNSNDHPGGSDSSPSPSLPSDGELATLPGSAPPEAAPAANLTADAPSDVGSAAAPPATLEAARVVQQKIKSAYAEGAQEPDPAALGATVESLLREARKTELPAVDRCGYYLEAFDRLRENEAFALAAPVVWEAQQQTNIVLSGLILEMLQDAVKRSRSVARRRELAQLTWLAAREALQRAELDRAEALAQLAAAQAQRTNDAEFKPMAIALRAEVEKLKRLETAAQRAHEQLVQGSSDPDLHLTYGRLLCLLHGDWRQGLPHLAEAHSSPYAQAANAELAGPTTAAGQLQLADQWWSLGESEDEVWSARLRSRAAYWCRQAIPAAKGAPQTIAIQRLTVSPPPSRDLLASAETANWWWNQMPRNPAWMGGRLLVGGQDIGARVEYELGMTLNGIGVADELQRRGVRGDRITIKLTGILENATPLRLGGLFLGGAAGARHVWTIDGQTWRQVAAPVSEATMREVALPSGRHVLEWLIEGVEGDVSRTLLFDAATGAPLNLAAAPATEPGAPPIRLRIQVSRLQ